MRSSLSLLSLCSSICLLQSTLSAQVGGRVGQLREFLPPQTSSNQWFASDVAAAGDVNADGFADILVSHHGGGGAWIYSGLDGSTLRFLQHPGATSYFGGTVAGVGDLNGDGHADVAVSDYAANTVYLISGADAAVLHTLHEPQPVSSFGLSLAGLDDVTGDGVPDIIVGAEQTSTAGNSFSGSVHLYSGATGAQVMRLDGAIPYEKLGAEVASAGDVDGDGVTDFLVISHKDSQPSGEFGSVRVFSAITGNQLFRATGETLISGDWMCADGIGDVNGDGFGDIAVGEESPWMPLNRKGVVTVYSGADSSRLWEWEGTGQEYVGQDIDATGDINGDGIPDVLVGIQGTYAHYTRDRRSAMLVSGHNGKFLARLSDGDPGSSLQYFASSVAAVGDTNGDGRTDFMVGDTGYLNNSGRAVLFGFNPQMTASATEISASLGGTVDLAIDFPQVDAGQSYAVLASRRGTGPFQGAGIRIPLTPDHVFRNAAGGQYPFANHTGMHGLLDSDGDATAQIVFQPLEVPGWMVGKTFYLAAVTADASGVSEKSSIVVGIRFLP